MLTYFVNNFVFLTLRAFIFIYMCERAYLPCVQIHFLLTVCVFEYVLLFYTDDYYFKFIIINVCTKEFYRILSVKENSEGRFRHQNHEYCARVEWIVISHHNFSEFLSKTADIQFRHLQTSLTKSEGKVAKNHVPFWHFARDHTRSISVNLH